MLDVLTSVTDVINEKDEPWCALIDLRVEWIDFCVVKISCDLIDADGLQVLVVPLKGLV